MSFCCVTLKINYINSNIYSIDLGWSQHSLRHNYKIIQATRCEHIIIISTINKTNFLAIRQLNVHFTANRIIISCSIVVYLNKQTECARNN